MLPVTFFRELPYDGIAIIIALKKSYLLLRFKLEPFCKGGQNGDTTSGIFHRGSAAKEF